MRETLATCMFLQGLLLRFGAAVGIKRLWWQLKWAMGVSEGELQVEREGLW